MDYVGFIDIYHDRVKAFHAKDAEFVRSARNGTYGGFQTWGERPGRFRTLGDGPIDFKSIYSRLTYHGFDDWAVVEWECYIKHPEDGARESAVFVKDHLVRASSVPFDAFMQAQTDEAHNQRILGI